VVHAEAFGQAQASRASCGQPNERMRHHQLNGCLASLTSAILR
jgi:hypothetical protein